MEKKVEILNKSNKNNQVELDDFKGMMGDEIVNAFQLLSNSVVYQNVAIFVDYDNVYWGLMKNYSHDPDSKSPEKNLFLKLWDKYGRDNVRTFKVFADFDSIASDLTSLQKKRVQIRHVYSKGRDDSSKKNSSDIELCIDAIESTYKDDKISCYVIVTADSDMIPLLSRLMYKGKRVELFYLSDSISKYADITTYAHQSYDLLNFLNVEIKSYNLDEYSVGALEFINKWWIDNERKPVFLGTNWLKGKLQQIFSLPDNQVSLLIEKLELESLIETVNKTVNEGEKKSVALTEKGVKALENGKKDVAVSAE